MEKQFSIKVPETQEGDETPEGKCTHLLWKSFVVIVVSFFEFPRGTLALLILCGSGLVLFKLRAHVKTQPDLVKVHYPTTHGSR